MSWFTKERRRAVAAAVVPFLGALIVRFIYFTNRKRYHIEAPFPETPVVVAMWHGDLLMLPFLYPKVRSGDRFRVIISEHFDGQMIAETAEYLGVKAIRGSSRRGGARVLIQALGLLKDGYDVAVTPDGPKGPRHSVADGVVVMAQKTGCKVVAAQCRPSRYWQFNSWDRFTVPKPFGRLDYFISEPFDLTGLDLDTAKSLVKMKLMKYSDEGENG